MIIYQIKNIKNDKCYIGQTIHTLSKRKSKHVHKLKKNQHSNFILQNAWNKYGEEAFEFEVIEKCDSIDELNEREEFLIKKYGDYNICINAITPSKANKLATKKSNSKTVHQYNLNGDYIQSFVSVKDASKKLNLNEVAIGRCARGINKHSGGFQWSYKKENKDNINKQNMGNFKKRVIQLSLDGVVIQTFNSLTEAAKETNSRIEKISAVCNNKRNKTGGYVWKFKK